MSVSDIVFLIGVVSISCLMLFTLFLVSENNNRINPYHLFCVGHGMTWSYEYRVGDFCIDGNGLAHQIACNGSLCGFVVGGES